MELWSTAVVVFLINLPFGWWRVTTRKSSLNWFLSIHVPVVLVIFLRIFSGVGWQFVAFLALVAAFSGGQMAGGWLYRWGRRHMVTDKSDN